MRIRNLLPVLLVSVCLAACSAAAGETAAKPPKKPTAVQVATWNRAVWDNQVRILTFTVAVNANQAKAWYEWAAAEDARRAAEEAARVEQRNRAPVRSQVPAKGSPAPTAPSGGVSGASGGVSGACGGATNGADRFIMRESGGNPNARNPSGARGCYQLMPEHFGARGACADLAPGPGDAACASRLPLSAWSSSGPTG